MRIVVVTSWHTDVGGGSGTATFFHAFVGGLRACYGDVEVIAPTLAEADYVEVTLERMLFNTELRTDPRIPAADLVIGFDYDGYGLDPQTRPPMITSVHAVYADVLPWETDPVRTMVQAQAFFDRVAMERADHVTIGSAYAKGRIVDLYNIAPEKITVIPHGLPEPSWLRYVDAIPRRENDHPIILSVGKMYPRKRTSVLLHAMALLRDKYPDVELRVVGDGLEWERLHRLADELKLNNNVTWLGHIADDARFAREWQQADVFCHPSRQETFGFVYLEAMMTGTPVVCADAGAAPEVLGDAAVFVEPENPEALANGLDHLLQDSALRDDLIQRGRERVPLFTQERMIDGYTRVIDSLTRI